MAKPLAYLAYNPSAGRLPIKPFVQRAAAILRSRGWEVWVRASEGSEHLTALAREAAVKEADAFFVAGGDGSVNLATAGLVGSETALGLLPAGTTNVFARDLGLPTPSLTTWDAIEKSAAILANAPVYRIDVGFCNRRPFLLWAGIGIDAMAVNELEPRAKWEKPFTIPQYLAVGMKSAIQIGGFPLRVIADEHSVEDTFLMAVALNIRMFAGVARLSRAALLDDGKMEMWLFKGKNLADAARSALEVLTGKHVDSDRIRNLAFSEAEVSSTGNEVPVQVDGEPNGMAQVVKIKVQQRAMRILVPPKARHFFSHQPERIITESV